jgi:adenylate cyclase
MLMGNPGSEVNDRRLAAILMADAVGFSARAAADERGALRALSACMEALERTTGLHGGRVVKTMGDGLMAEFGSVVSAISAAAAMQAMLAERNRTAAEAGRLQFRIGVHVSDVIVAGQDLLGDGVNIAARLEAAADPGGVLISARVFEDVEGKLDLAFSDRGDVVLKGLPRPIRVYALEAGTPAPSPPAPELPDKPSVAVLPFANMSSDTEQEFFTDGLTEDIITGLATVPWLFVIARNSTFTYKGAAVDVRKVGRELGVAYVLEGSVRRAGNRLRITGQLIDAASGKHLWADRIDGALEDVFDLQDQVTDSVIRAIAPEIQTAEIERARAKRPDSLTAYDHLLHGLAALHRAKNADAIAHLERAIEAAPNYGKALAVRSWCSTLQFAWQGETDYDRVRAEGLVYARRALEAAPADPEVWAFAGYTLSFFCDDVEGGMAMVRDAAESCPSFYWAQSSLNMLHGLHGHEPEATLERIERTMRLSPKDPLRHRDLIARAHCLRQLGRDEEQFAAAKEAFRINPNITVARANMIVALHSIGRMDEAREVARRMLEWNPDFSVDEFLSHSVHFEASYGRSTQVWPALEKAFAGLGA